VVPAFPRAFQGKRIVGFPWVVAGVPLHGWYLCSEVNGVVQVRMLCCLLVLVLGRCGGDREMPWLRFSVNSVGVICFGEAIIILVSKVHEVTVAILTLHASSKRLIAR
jgi:hypothetical protein